MQRTVSLLSIAFLAIGVAWMTMGTTPKPAVGQQMPELRLDYVGNKPEAAGQPMVVEFWATWCGPCKQTIPHLNALHRKFKDKGLVIVGVTDEDNQTIRKFTKTTPMEYPVATDRGGKLSAAMGISGIPHAVLVSKTGKILWQGYPTQIRESDLEAALK